MLGNLNIIVHFESAALFDPFDRHLFIKRKDAIRVHTYSPAKINENKDFCLSQEARMGKRVNVDQNSFFLSVSSDVYPRDEVMSKQ